jgi:hypothetical protein
MSKAIVNGSMKTLSQAHVILELRRRRLGTYMLLYRYRIYISEQWRTTAESSDERPYNAALEKIASISDSKVEPQTLRLKNEWDKATQNEQRLCVEKADEACRAKRAAADGVCKKCV